MSGVKITFKKDGAGGYLWTRGALTAHVTTHHKMTSLGVAYKFRVAFFVNGVERDAAEFDRLHKCRLFLARKCSD